MEVEELKQLAIDALEDLKGKDIKVLDVRGKSNITDVMVFVSGTSGRHLKSLGESVVVKAKQAGVPPLGIEGENSGEWVLVDLGDVVVHVMMPEIRDFYKLEKLWQVDAPVESEGGAH